MHPFLIMPKDVPELVPLGDTAWNILAESTLVEHSTSILCHSGPTNSILRYHVKSAPTSFPFYFLDLIHASLPLSSLTSSLVSSPC